MAVRVLCRFLAVSWVGMQHVIVAFSLTLLIDKGYNRGISFFFFGGGGEASQWLKFWPLS